MPMTTSFRGLLSVQAMQSMGKQNQGNTEGVLSAGLSSVLPGNWPEVPTLTVAGPTPTPTEPLAVPLELTPTPTLPKGPIGRLMPTPVVIFAQPVIKVKANRPVAQYFIARPATDFIVFPNTLNCFIPPTLRQSRVACHAMKCRIVQNYRFNDFLRFQIRFHHIPHGWTGVFAGFGYGGPAGDFVGFIGL
jgi:hypothetical protein